MPATARLRFWRFRCGRKTRTPKADSWVDQFGSPGIYTKLFDIDKVDLVISGYGTNIIAPAMQLVMQHNRVFMSLAGLAVNEHFHYDKYFQIFPFGPDPKLNFARGFFDVAMGMDPKPKTVAISVADSEFPQTAAAGARKWAKKYGLKIVYDGSFPPNQVDFAPILRAVQSTNPDIVYISCFPPNTVGIVRAVNEMAFKSMLIGGGMVGPQYATVKQQLGPLLNGFMSFESYVPARTTDFPGIKEFLARYKYIHGTTHHTIVGDIRFGADGEWSEARVLQVQYQNVKGNGLEQFEQPGTQVVLFPAAYKSGTLEYPFGKR